MAELQAPVQLFSWMKLEELEVVSHAMHHGMMRRIPLPEANSAIALEMRIVGLMCWCLLELRIEQSRASIDASREVGVLGFWVRRSLDFFMKFASPGDRFKKWKRLCVDGLFEGFGSIAH